MNKRTKIVRDTLMYIWNTNWDEFCMNIFEFEYATAEDHKKNWVSKYKNAWQNNASNLFTMLDNDKMNRITDLARERYGDIDGV
jgi:hypothetical protein